MILDLFVPRILRHSPRFKLHCTNSADRWLPGGDLLRHKTVMVRLYRPGVPSILRLQEEPEAMNHYRILALAIVLTTFTLGAAITSFAFSTQAIAGPNSCSIKC